MKRKPRNREEEKRLFNLEARWKVVARNVFGDGMQFYAVGPITVRYLMHVARALMLEDRMLFQNLSWSEDRWLTVDLGELKKDPLEVPFLP